MMRSTPCSSFIPSLHSLQVQQKQQQQHFTQRTFQLWIFFTFLVIAGSDSGEGSSSSSSSSQTSTDEVVGTAEARGPQSCNFPLHWVGSWFQSGVHHSISVSANAISTKGKCLEADGNKYLVYQQRSNCYKCIAFNEKHVNVLMYKETYCHSERNSLAYICSKISGDYKLNTMFRLDAAPIDCPLQGPHTFSYDRGYGECSQPESSLDSCTQTSRLIFNYQACPDVPRTESVEEELQCLAAWKEGSYRYFVGLIQYRHHASSYEDRFRCFAYEKLRRGAELQQQPSHHHHHQYPQSLALGRSRPFTTTAAAGPHSLTSAAESVHRVVQSGDATCDGLSSMEGSRTMYLRKAPETITQNCQFPSWVQTHPQWHSLDQSSIYEFDGERFRVKNFSEQLINANGPDSLAMSGSCMKLLEDEPGHRAVVILHARAGCKIGYQCMVLHKRDADILEVQFGEWSRKHEEACQFYFNRDVQPYITLVSSTPQRAQCPAIGKFSMKIPREQLSSFVGESPSSSCSTNGSLRMGCSSLDSVQLEISSQCRDNNDDGDDGASNLDRRESSSSTTKQVTDYDCHGWWEEDGITYLVATLSSTSTKLRPKRHCFVFRDSSSDSPSPPHWMRLQQSQEGQLARHSSGPAFRARLEESSSFGNSRTEESPATASSTSAALSFFNNNNNNNHAAGKILEISSFADSCRRNVVVGREGDFAFNATKIGHCFASSSSPSGMIRGGSVSKRGISLIMVMSRMTTEESGPGLFQSLLYILPVVVVMLR